MEYFAGPSAIAIPSFMFALYSPIGALPLTRLTDRIGRRFEDANLGLPPPSVRAIVDRHRWCRIGAFLAGPRVPAGSTTGCVDSCTSALIHRRSSASRGTFRADGWAMRRSLDCCWTYLSKTVFQLRRVGTPLRSNCRADGLDKVAVFNPDPVWRASASRIERIASERGPRQ